MVAERVNSSQKLLDVGEKGLYSSYTPVRNYWTWVKRAFILLIRLRPRLAYGVRDRLLRTDSANCRSCHDESGIEPGFTRGKREHERAKKEKITCIACHYNLVHKKVRPREDFLVRSKGLSPKERQLIEEQEQKQEQKQKPEQGG